MCEYMNVTYRLGTVVSARDAAGEEARPKVPQAWAMGEQMRLHPEEYHEALQRAVESEVADAAFLDAPGKTSFDKDEKVRTRFSPGLVVDFRQLTLPTALGKISFRTCVTVCSGTKLSKIWTRATTHFPEDKETPLSQEWIDSFHMLSREIANETNKKVAAHYEKDFSSALGKTVKLSPTYSVNILAVDCRGGSIGETVREYMDDITYLEHSMREVEDEELSTALRAVTELGGVPVELRDTNPDNSQFGLNEDANLFPFSAFSGGDSIFVAHSNVRDGYLMGVVAEKPSSAGVEFVREAGHSAPLAPSAYNNSSRTSAELATFIGERF